MVRNEVFDERVEVEPPARRSLLKPEADGVQTGAPAVQLQLPPAHDDVSQAAQFGRERHVFGGIALPFLV